MARDRQRAAKVARRARLRQGHATQRDVFLCHAGEDKQAIARPLAMELRLRGLDVWYDEFTLHVGDSLRREIDRGLALSRFGIVILSAHFFRKEWPQRELDGLVTRELAGDAGIILPVWHGVDRGEVARYSLPLADRVAVSTTRGIDFVVDHLLAAITRRDSATRRPTWNVDPLL